MIAPKHPINALVEGVLLALDRHLDRLEGKGRRRRFSRSERTHVRPRVGGKWNRDKGEDHEAGAEALDDN